jgi:hypothetical protein
MNRTLLVRQLKDGTGRACIHWLRPDPAGLVRTGRREESGRPPQYAFAAAGGTNVLGGIVGTIACRPAQNTVEPQHRGQEVALCLHTIEVDAVTCPDCRSTAEWVAAERLNRDNDQKEKKADEQPK